MPIETARVSPTFVRRYLVVLAHNVTLFPNPFPIEAASNVPLRYSLLRHFPKVDCNLPRVGDILVDTFATVEKSKLPNLWVVLERQSQIWLVQIPSFRSELPINGQILHPFHIIPASRATPVWAPD